MTSHFRKRTFKMTRRANFEGTLSPAALDTANKYRSTGQSLRIDPMDKSENGSGRVENPLLLYSAVGLYTSALGAVGLLLITFAPKTPSHLDAATRPTAPPIAEMAESDEITTGSISKDIPVPRSAADDTGRYYIVDVRRADDHLIVTHRRAGVDRVVWTRSEVICDDHQYRDLGTSNVGPLEITATPTKWLGVAPGTSRSDVFKVACAQ